MQEAIAPTEHFTFDIEIAIDEQHGAIPLPFPGMDKSGAAVCKYFGLGTCHRGTACPFRHVTGEKTVVCKHWLRGLCKKGDDCEFLHEYDLTKMPECFFYAKFASCSNKECPFLHIDPATKIKDCPWYDRGFCRHGPNCKNRHTRRVMCINYLCGFCPSGAQCKKAHPRFEVPTFVPEKSHIICHHCGEPGHKVFQCLQLPQEERQKLIDQHHERPHHFLNSHHFVNRFFNKTHQSVNAGETGGKQEQTDRPEYVRRPLHEVTCFKCGEKGHFANRCPKGHLAFLSSALQNQPANQR